MYPLEGGPQVIQVPISRDVHADSCYFPFLYPNICILHLKCQDNCDVMLPSLLTYIKPNSRTNIHGYTQCVHIRLSPSEYSNAHIPAVPFFKKLNLHSSAGLCFYMCERETGPSSLVVECRVGGGWVNSFLVWQRRLVSESGSLHSRTHMHLLHLTIAHIMNKLTHRCSLFIQPSSALIQHSLWAAAWSVCVCVCSSQPGIFYF